MAATVVEAAAADRLLTEEVALVDRSERGKLALTGAQAKELLSGQVTNDIEALDARQRLLRRPADQQGQDAGRPACHRHRLRAAGSTPSAWRSRRSSTPCAAARWAGRPSCTSARSQQALLSLVGPHARAGRGRRGRAGARPTARAQLGGADVLLVATDLGVDVVCAAEDADRVRGALDVARRARGRRGGRCASSPGARATASTSTSGTIPQEAGLNERAVSFTKGCYVGQETVARLHYRGKPNRHLRGLRCRSRSRRTPLVLGEREVGRSARASFPRFGPSGWRWRGARRRGRRARRWRGARGRRRAAVLAVAHAALRR